MLSKRVAFCLRRAAKGLVPASALLTAAGCATAPDAGIAMQPGAAPAELQALARRANAGDKEAQLELGIRFEEGRGVARNLARAEKLYRAAAGKSGGVTYVYNPPATKGGAGNLIRLDHGAPTAGLPAARERLERLQRLRKATKTSPVQIDWRNRYELV